MLLLPPGTDLHSHPLVTNGKVFLQGKASCMVAVALCPKPGWKVIDACAAPGNKTVHLAALMNGQGGIIACELNKERAKTLQNTIRRSGANSILSLLHFRSVLFCWTPLALVLEYLQRDLTTCFLHILEMIRMIRVRAQGS